MTEYRCLSREPDPNGGDLGQDWSSASSFPIGSGQRGLFWLSEAILVLAPAANAPTSPSFDCRKAQSASETAICRDPPLANWDRSVAAAYTLVRDGGSLVRDGGGVDEFGPASDPERLAESQRLFLVERNRCGADRTCLTDRMYERTDALMRGQYTMNVPR